MELFAAALIDGEKVTVLALNGEGGIADTVVGETLTDALGALPERPHRVVVADEARAPRAVALGVIDVISLESAIRAAALAGLSVVESVSINDPRDVEERLSALVGAAPEQIVLAGGTDDGDVAHLEELAVLAAEVRARLTDDAGRGPSVLFAGNPMAEELCRQILGDDLEATDNVRPSCERENLSPAVIRLAVLTAEASAGADASAAVPAGAARAFAARDLSNLQRCGVLLAREQNGSVELVSKLGPGWNRIVGRDLEGAISLHREWARELAGVALLREIADAFAEHVAGRDLLEVEPPGLLVGTGSAWEGAAVRDSVRRLVDGTRPRGVLRVARADPAQLALLGLCALDGWSPSPAAYASALETVAYVVSLDGQADSLEIRQPTGATLVAEGDVEWVELAEPCEVAAEPRSRGDLGEGRGARVLLEVEEPGIGLLVDARGTVVPPTRRTRILDV